jgi:hypothetical protein
MPIGPSSPLITETESLIYLFRPNVSFELSYNILTYNCLVKPNSTTYPISFFILYSFYEAISSNLFKYNDKHL